MKKLRFVYLLQAGERNFSSHFGPPFRDSLYTVALLAVVSIRSENCRKAEVESSGFETQCFEVDINGCFVCLLSHPLISYGFFSFFALAVTTHLHDS